MEEIVKEIIKVGAKIGLKINEDKTRIMRIGKQLEKNKIKIEDYTFEEVNMYKYLAVMITSNGEREVEVKEKIMQVNRAIHANKKLLKSKILGKNTKIKIYKTIIRLIIMYAAETMSMMKKQEEDLRILERKVFRIILEPIKIRENEFRRRTTE